MFQDRPTREDGRGGSHENAVLGDPWVGHVFHGPYELRLHQGQ
jgi:hypothetical protein